jgi:hypothetical protein
MVPDKPKVSGRILRIILAGAVAALVLPGAQALGGGEETAILSRGVTVEGLSRMLLPPSDWHPFPRAGERAPWSGLPPRVRAAYLREAEKLLHSQWPTPKATEFLEFVRSGDRSGYQAVSFGRRESLATLVIAECIENRGRFRDDIVNGIWTICEETYWGVPAHVSLQRRGPGLPDVTEPTVDLFAAETGSLLAWTYYLLQDSLDLVSPLVSERIRLEVDRRINAVNLVRDDFWWMGLTRKVNNWTPWICSNWLATVLILEHDPDRRARSVYKILQCLDRFLAEYADDGGCDEGPSYWGRAAASLYDCLELLHSSTRGGIDHYANPRVREMGRFITRAHISGPWYVNFADAPARLAPDAPVVYRYGRAIGDQPMMSFTASLAREQRLDQHMLPGRFGVLGRVLPGLFVLGEVLAASPAEPAIRDSYFGGIQVMTARSASGSSRGLYLAAQGGHNDESHNHNDVGNLVVYLDGEPVLIDVGVETYTAKTFGKDRYAIWTMQSGYHNVPTINGVMQNEGREYAAREVRYTADEKKASLAMEIASAYPPEAGVRSWSRTITLERGAEVVLRDAYSLASVRGVTSQTLMTCREPDLTVPGRILLVRPAWHGTARDAEVLYDSDLFAAASEPIDIRDKQLRESWGGRIWRVVLTVRQPSLAGEWTIRVRQRQ